MWQASKLDSLGPASYPFSSKAVPGSLATNIQAHLLSSTGSERKNAQYRRSIPTKSTTVWS